MKKIVTTLFVLLIFIVSGCSSAELKISEEQAKSSVIEHHSCENGIDSVDGENGAIEMIKASIC